IEKSLEAPFRTIVSNAGHEASVLLEKIRNSEGATGFNALAERVEDLVKAGVIDPTKVSRSALQNAASVAGLMLTTEAVIADKPEPKSDHSHGPAGMGGMGGMGGMM
ncbi:MAG: chaperonin GroEL, partial [Bdellovibrionales bacterium]|nr:chaperonin GroEL [Bdellovibrionales bacterium]